MRSYLSLIPVSASVHRKQSRMTRICIVLAVFLISSIFGMADMEIQNEKRQAIQSDGAWHVAFRDLTVSQKQLLKERPEIAAASDYAVINYNLDEDYQIAGRKTVICGFDEDMRKLFPAMALTEGSFPQTDSQVIVTESTRERLGVGIGDTVVLDMPKGEFRTFVIAGFTGETPMLARGDAYGVFMNTKAYEKLCNHSEQEIQWMYYIQFKSRVPVQKTLTDIKGSFALRPEQVTENAKMLGLMLQSSDSYLRQLYRVAVVLAMLVAVSGILMIMGSLNSNVAERTEFFGMLRCLGATRKQLICFVRLEALNWCKTAIPIGILLSTVVEWGLGALLKYMSPKYFAGMPSFYFSLVGAASGIIMGLITVLIAAGKPAKRAAEVSPLTAVSGNAEDSILVKRAANVRLLPVESALGVHHAKGNTRNFLLLISSFAFSIIMFLTFGILIDFMYHAVNPLKPYTPDLSIVSTDNSCTIPVELTGKLLDNPVVKRAYGRSFAYQMTVQLGEKTRQINLISYEKNQFDWAKKDVVDGSLTEAEKGEGLLIVYNSQNDAWAGEAIAFANGASVTGDSRKADEEQREFTEQITGILRDSPFHDSQDVDTVICSEELFHRLTGEENYTIIDIQLKKDATDADVEAIRQSIGEGYVFSDQRSGNQEARAAFYSMALFVYGFLGIIALIAAFHVINSISMSVASRMQQYGAMRAIGMSVSQLIQMVAAEAVTYGGFGMLLGLVLGIPLNKLLFEGIISSRWGDPWRLPISEIVIIFGIMAVAIIFAIYSPAGKIRRMSIVDTISAR